MEIRLYDRERDADKLRVFNAAVFGTAPSTENRAPTAPENPYGVTPGPTAIALLGDKIVGHLTSTPFSLWLQHEEKIAYWLSGFHVLPETRDRLRNGWFVPASTILDWYVDRFGIKQANAIQ